MKKEKEILFFCPRWGSEQLSWMDFFDKAKSAGYDGIEFAISREVRQRDLDEVWNLSAMTGMPVIAQHYDTYESGFARHWELYQDWFDKIEPFEPFKINSQTGKDTFSKYQNTRLIHLAHDFSLRTGIPVVHETHRGKFSFAAHLTGAYLKSLPDLRLTLDASHWVNVHESLLEDQQRAMMDAIARTDHIHARIGHAQGPQVPDPRMAEWQPALQAHLSWWDKVFAEKRLQNETLTITTEFGPFPYMVNIPGSGDPVANQWEVNIYMLNLLKERYAK